MGKSFSERVLEAAARIPRGKVTTYRELARIAGNPGASRAAGSVMKNNMCPETIPCYRVVRSDGSVGNYSNGGANEKARRLQRDGIGISNGKIDLRKHFHSFR